jgi:hypothetical protein
MPSAVSALKHANDADPRASATLACWGLGDKPGSKLWCLVILQFMSVANMRKSI